MADVHEEKYEFTTKFFCGRCGERLIFSQGSQKFGQVDIYVTPCEHHSIEPDDSIRLTGTPEVIEQIKRLVEKVTNA